MRFHKFQALGNDFLIVREAALRAVTEDFEAISQRLCDRHFGVGADGVELLLDKTSAPGADFEVRLFNADGGETPISGNGTRCVGAYLYGVLGWDRPEVRIATGAGVKTLRPVEKRGGGYVFESAMGRPRLASKDIPVLLPQPLDRVVAQPIEIDGTTFTFTATSMGNPHCSLRVEDFDRIEWRRIGARLETHPSFPDRTNVEFIRVIDRHTIEVRFWERGCGETLASGTGSCGASLAAMLNDWTERKITVRTQAGALIVEWREDNEVMQTGEARPVFSGEWPEGSL
jgi:diaminopimelate epimerase